MKSLKSKLTENKTDINKIGLWEWFDKNSKIGWTIEVMTDGKHDNRTYNVYDEKKNGIGSWDEVDGWQWNSLF